MVSIVMSFGQSHHFKRLPNQFDRLRLTFNSSVDKETACLELCQTVKDMLLVREWRCSDDDSQSQT